MVTTASISNDDVNHSFDHGSETKPMLTIIIIIVPVAAVTSKTVVVVAIQNNKHDHESDVNLQ